MAASEKVPARKLIGKFGIGKLASYSVGRRITHLCKSDDGYLLVHIDYRALGLDATREASDVPEDAARASSRPDDTAATGGDGRPENADGPADEPHRSRSFGCRRTRPVHGCSSSSVRGSSRT